MVSPSTALESLAIRGFVVLENVLEAEILAETRQRMDSLLAADRAKFGDAALLAAREMGTLRYMMAADSFFLGLLNLPPVMAIIEALLGEACIVHLQNGIVLLPNQPHQQAVYHQDYRRWMGGYDVSFNAFFLIDPFTAENGGTWVVPSTHLLADRPSDSYLAAHGQQIIAPAGSALIFNSRLWHKGGENRTQSVRRAINTQYTYSYIRQQADYAHCLPEADYDALPSRTQQLLGRYVRMPKNIDEFRRPSDERLYRSGQG
jgi:ectoine hydroxylase-related dioxygenase (phytanoyl-CoA dioxygenase family)